MLIFENGDVLLNAEEYKNLMTRNGLQNLLGSVSKYFHLYHKLDAARLPLFTVEFEPKPYLETEYYRISDKEYKVWIEWRKLIAEFKP